MRIDLLSWRAGVIHVVTAVITAERENMNTSIAEETGTAQAPATGEKPKAAKKARVAPQGAHVVKKKGKSAKKATPAKKAPKAAKKPTDAREGSKTNTILDLLTGSGGLCAKELMKATGWQPHSVRGFLSGTIGKKMGLTITSVKSEDGERSYSIKG
jgi:outer membrane biosynthesis protein TonB